MKNILIIIGMLTLSLTAFTSTAQVTINQLIVSKPSYKVGDTIQVKYTVAKGTATPRYFWLRYQFNNKALSYVNTTWSQGSSVQTFYTGWSNYKFTPSTANGITATSLYSQYLATPWGYAINSDWNVGQLTVQRTDASVDGDIATQKYVIKDLGTYNDIHKLDLSYSIDATGVNISPITTTTGLVSLSNVIGNTSQFKVRVLFPSNYDITAHSVSLIPLTTNGDVNWTAQAITTKPLDASGEALFTTEVKVGDSFAVFVNAATQKTFMNNIVTVSDAYKAFLGVSQTDISGTSNYFTYPSLEKRVGLITKEKTTFSESDSYNLFAHVMGLNVTSAAMIPSNAAPVNGVVNFKWHNGLLNQSWLDGTPLYKTTVTSANQAVDMVFAWGGDLDWSHSSDPAVIASRISSGNYNNSVNLGDVSTVKTMSVQSMSYNQVFEETKLSLSSSMANGKVVLSGNLTKEGLAGLEVILQYDNSKLTFDNISFDAGPSITNFSTNEDGRLTFGSMDQTKTSRIKSGTPYKLTFIPKVTLSNTAGLFYTVLADAVDGNGKKVNLIVE
jgi:cytochrome b involved in lipid metabolism